MSIAAQTIVASLDPATQAELALQVREVCRASPPVRPLARRGQPMSVRVTSAGELGWGGDGSSYTYKPVDPHGKPWPPIPKLWTEIADRAAAGPQPWDCAIINWYDPDARLGEHRDLGERDQTRPIVTISLGDTAV